MPKKQEEETKVATTGSTAVVGHDYGDDAGSGFEHSTGSDLTVPFINILQALSPEVQKGTVEGAKAGHIYNTVTQELRDAVVFQPVVKQSLFVEWVPRNKGGGLVKMHSPDSEIVTTALKKVGGRALGPLPLGTIDKEGKGETELVETVYLYGLLLDPDGSEYEGFGVVSFTSTKLKIWRNWHTAMYTIKGAKKPPLFAHRAKLKTFLDSNKSNQEFYNFMITPLKATWMESLLNPEVEAERALLVQAKQFREMVESGLARADFTNQEEGGNAGDGDTPF